MDTLDDGREVWMGIASPEMSAELWGTREAIDQAVQRIRSAAPVLPEATRAEVLDTI
jgi:hypothetical protein